MHYTAPILSNFPPNPKVFLSNGTILSNEQLGLDIQMHLGENLLGAKGRLFYLHEEMFLYQVLNL